MKRWTHTANIKASKYQCYYNETAYIDGRAYKGKKVLDKVFDTEEEAEEYCSSHVGAQEVDGEWIDNEMFYEEI